MITLQEIDFLNRDFGVGFMATSFPTAWEEETDIRNMRSSACHCKCFTEYP